MTNRNNRLGVLPILAIAILTTGALAGPVWSEEQGPDTGAESEDWYAERESTGDRPEFGRSADRGYKSQRVGPGRHQRRGFGPGGPGGPGGVERLHMALRELDLGDAQRSEIRAIFNRDRDEAIATHERTAAVARELEQQITDSSFDENAVREKAAELAAIRVEMAVVRARQLNQVRQVLTPDQLEQLEQMKEEREAFREERRERFERRRGVRGGF